MTDIKRYSSEADLDYDPEMGNLVYYKDHLFVVSKLEIANSTILILQRRLKFLTGGLDD